MGIPSSIFASIIAGSDAGPIKLASFGDSRADLMGGGSTGPDQYDGLAVRAYRATWTNNSTFFCSLPEFMDDIIITTNGGCSGEQTAGWNSGGRLGGRTYAAVLALPWDAIFIQYGTNDIKNNVISTATRDSVATTVITNLQALINQLLSDTVNNSRKIIFQTTMQRSDTTGDNAYGATNAVNMRDCCDYINYGNGGSITGMVAWIQALPEYNSRIFIHDISTLMNIGGAQTGAYLDTTWAPDGCHVSYRGARRISLSYATLLRTIYSDRGIKPLYRRSSGNCIPSATSSYYGNEILSHCSKSAITYGTDAQGRSYGETTITPDNVAVGSYKFELLADVGTNGGRTPLGPTFAVNDLLQARALLTIDDGAGNASVVNNVYFTMYCSYIGGTPGLQTNQNGQATQGTGTHNVADVVAQYLTPVIKMTGDSSLIGAPAGGSGLRLFIQIYFGITSTPFRVRWTSPEIRHII